MRILIRASQHSSRFSERRSADGGNSGNLLFAQSVYKSLLKPGNMIDANEYDPAFANPDAINERYDAFVLPFANAFRPQFEPFLRQYTALIRQLKIPCIVVGVGCQAGLDLAELRGAPIDNSVRQFVSAVLDRSASIGVRGEITQTYLNRLGFQSVDVIGCPSMFLNGRPLRIEKPDTAFLATVAVNHSPGTPKSFEDFLGNVLTNYPLGVLVAQESSGAALWSDRMSKMDWGGSHFSNEKSNDAPPRVNRFTNVQDWIAFMKTRDFSVGTRIHGNIAALLAGTPATVVVPDSRTLEICRYHAIPHVLIDTISAETSAVELYRSADFGHANSASERCFERYKTFLKANELDHSFVEHPDVAKMQRSQPAGPSEVAVEMHGTDRARWSDTGNLKESWRYRSTLAARHVPPGATVLDIGCGKMALEEMLPERCRYIPVDLVARDSRTVVCDLNNGEYPHADGITHIVVLGVLEYLSDAGAFFAWLARAECKSLILSYVTLNERMPPPKRRAVGWVNDFVREELLDLATRSHFELASEEWINQNGRIFVFEKQLRPEDATP